jgi:4a-hydroxytetrahydrobiopterin dehydratase
MNKLKRNEILEKLKKFPTWSFKKILFREFHFNTYLNGIKALNQISEVAENLNHHPDLFLGYKKLKVEISTHDVNGISDLDFKFLEEVEKLKLD